MKIQTLFLFSHATTAAVAVLAFGVAERFQSGASAWGAAAIAASGAVGGIAFFLATRFRSHLAVLTAVGASPGSASTAATGVAEIDHTAAKLTEQAARWDEMAANGREQMRDVQAVLMLLNRRGGGGQVNGAELRQVLGSIGQTLHGNLDQMEQSAAELARCTQEIAEGAEIQGNAVIKTSTYVEQLSSNIDLISDNTKLVQEAILTTRTSAREGLQRLADLLQGMERIRTHSLANEKKLRGLNDPSRQISSIVATIGDIAARTDLLALNASIESIRAGEHGRGFAVVADEVRKLAEQTAQASREIAGLIESIQLATQESITGLIRERSDVEAEVNRAAALETALKQIGQAAEGDASRAGDIATAAHQQLQLMQDVVLAMEQISNVAKSSRSRAENACWTMKTLSKIRTQIDASIDQLRRCSDRHRNEPADQLAIEPPPLPVGVEIP
ncbi:methyl-accepting chemotaxis protein [Candidatus Laterigemmans baculatus]|uniref:methyl-accepting chemotaxis protein n=1 Tax=Candidatus Laterigemmans baculatus TaxID=2770505 RepID=UPI0013D8E7A7|nr:methyl-accepting chemotaxis protein [Candidatus Laterigemmans baculatus]